MPVAGPVEFSAWDITLIILALLAPPLLTGLIVGGIWSYRAEPEARWKRGLFGFVIGFLGMIAVTVAISGISGLIG
jgi:hypothetical protein